MLLMLFENTIQAMDADDAVTEQKLPAKLIPLPESVKAGCGLGLWLQAHDQTWWKDLFEKEQLGFSAIEEGEFF